MVISVSNTITHNVACEKPKLDQKSVEKEVLQRLELLGLASEDVSWNEQGHLELRNPSDLKLHTLLLHMESLGLDLKLTKQTLVEIC